MNRTDNPVKNMNKMALLLLAGSITLSACGARTDEGTVGNTGTGTPSTPSSTPTSTPSTGGADPVVGNPDPVAGDALTVTLRTDTSRLTTGGSDVANIRATVIDADKRAIANQTVSFSASGGILQDISAATNDRGEASAVLSLTNDLRNNPITVTVTADQYQSSVVVDAGGTALTALGDNSVVLGKPVELQVFLKDGTGEAITNENIVFTSAQSNTLTPATATTDSDGRVLVSIGSDNGSDTISITTLSETVIQQFDFIVSADQLSFPNVGADPIFAVGESTSIDVVWTRQGAPVANADLQISTTAGQLDAAIVRTDASGRATLGITANSASEAQIKVSSLSAGGPTDTLRVTFAALNPAVLELTSSVSRVNTDSTSEITATVLDSNDNPVLGKRVVFQSADLRGGELASASATTDAKGKATVQFNSGTAATEENAVQISATVDGTNISDATFLTIVKKSLNITMGTANLVSKTSDNSPQYYVDFVVQVADGSGAPLENADVYLSIEPTHYYKGQFVYVDKDGFGRPSVIDPDDEWTPTRWSLTTIAICAAEDANNNNILDVDASGTEDFNNNQRLDPQDPASLAASLEAGVATLQGGGFLQTDSTGSGYFRMIYPVSNATWARVEITAAARELGAEAVTTYGTELKVVATEQTNLQVSPANRFSPYGTDTSTCANEN